MLADFDIVADPDRLPELREAWNQLWLQVPDAAFYQSYDHAIASCRAYGVGRSGRLWCLVGRREGALALVWPFRLDRLGVWSLLRAIGPGYWEYDAPLAACDRREDLIDEALGFILSQAPADLMRQIAVKDCSPMLPRFVTAGAVVIHKPTYYETNWRGSADEALTLRQDASQRRNEARRRRNLAQLGAVGFEVATDGETVAGLVDWVLEHKRSWSLSNGRDSPWLWCDAFSAYLKALLSNGQSPLQPVAFVLRLNGLPIAVKLATRSPRILDGIIAAYDPAYSRHSPGTRLDEYWIQWAFEAGLEVDFGIGSETNKKMLSNDNARTASTLLLPLTGFGRMALALRRLKEALRRWAGRPRRVPALAGGIGDAKGRPAF